MGEGNKEKNRNSSPADDDEDYEIRRERLAMIGEMLAGVVHELNNPLTSVMGFSDLMENSDSVAELKEYAATIRKEAMRCRRIATNLLNFSRRERQIQECFNVNELIQDILELKTYDFRGIGIEVSLSLGPSLPGILGDPYEIQQVFLNLANNAQHAMVHQVRRKVLAITTSCRRQKVVIEIKDTGPGIPQHIAGKIFEPFFTTKPQGQGTGLGLGICLKIVKRHRGAIVFSNAKEGGACFTLEFPAAAPALQPETGDFMQLKSDFKFQGLKVLIVDDEPHLVRFYETALNRLGCEVVGFLNVQRALDYLEGGTFDLMIIDYRMRGESGKVIFDFVREKKPNLARRIIFSSGDTYDPTMRQAIEKNGNLFLPKPCTLAEITEAMEKTLALIGDS